MRDLDLRLTRDQWNAVRLTFAVVAALVLIFTLVGCAASRPDVVYWATAERHTTSQLRMGDSDMLMMVDEVDQAFVFTPQGDGSILPMPFADIEVIEYVHAKPDGGVRALRRKRDWLTFKLWSGDEYEFRVMGNVEAVLAIIAQTGVPMSVAQY